MERHRRCGDCDTTAGRIAPGSVQPSVGNQRRRSDCAPGRRIFGTEPCLWRPRSYQLDRAVDDRRTANEYGWRRITAADLCRRGRSAVRRWRAAGVIGFATTGRTIHFDVACASQKQAQAAPSAGQDSRPPPTYAMDRRPLSRAADADGFFLERPALHRRGRVCCVLGRSGFRQARAVRVHLGARACLNPRDRYQNVATAGRRLNEKKHRPRQMGEAIIGCVRPR